MDTALKAFDYIQALGQSNRQVVVSLKLCGNLLAHIQPWMANKEDCQDILDEVERIVEVGDKVVEKTKFH